MRSKITNAMWGLFFIIIGVGFAGDVMKLWDFHLFFDGWWTFFIIIPCFISMIQSGFGTGSTIGFIIGIMLFVSSRVDLDFNLWRLVVPAILIFIGLRILLQGMFRRKPNYYDQSADYTGSGDPGFAGGQSYSGTAKGEYSAVFASNKVHITDLFTGTNLNAIFGGIVLDLRDAKIPGDIEVNASAIFGGIDIYLPAGVNIKINNVPIFGGVSNKNNQPAQPGAPTIYLNSTCMFGGIDIK